ncbi:hypothetical protein B0H14DRAFT_3674016 [Mycena olivaceomarginata]|nr:hypothetical protein B0H14DRAFT_3674016 [Mycena olivaceomarginata]
MILGTLSLLCDSRYLLWALASALSIYAVHAQWPMWALASALSTVYVVNSQTPTQKLGEINRAIQVCEEILEHAESACARDHVELTECMHRLFEVEMSASRIRVQLLEKHHDFTTWKGCVEYVKDMHDLWKKIHQCVKDLKEIGTSTLVTLENENQRKSGENIRDCDEICDALGSQWSARRRRRLGQTLTTGNTAVSYEALTSV